MIRAAAYDIQPVIDKVTNAVNQTQLARLPVDNGQHDDAEADLKLRVLIEIVENDLCLLAALQLENNSQAVTVAFVADIRNAFNFFIVQQRRSMLDQPGFVHLVGNFRNDDLLAVFTHALDRGASAQLQLPPALSVGVDNPLTAQNEPARGEIRPGHHFSNLVKRRLRILNQCDGSVDDLGEIVRRKIGGHANGNSGGAVNQQVRHACR